MIEDRKLTESKTMDNLNSTVRQRTISVSAFNKLISTQEGRNAVKSHGHVSGQTILVYGKDEPVVQAAARALRHWSVSATTISAVTLFASVSKEPTDGYMMLTLNRDEVMELQEAAENELAATPVLMHHLI